MSIYFAGFNNSRYFPKTEEIKPKKDIKERRDIIFNSFQSQFNYTVEKMDCYQCQVKIFYYNISDVFDFLQNSGVRSGIIFSELEKITQDGMVGRESFIRNLENKPRS